MSWKSEESKEAFHGIFLIFLDPLFFAKQHFGFFATILFLRESKFD